MNMILSPQEMLDRRPEAKRSLAEYYTIMPTLDLTPAAARLLLEYLRQVRDRAPAGS